MELGIAEILNTLPHRYPFLLVDRILELEPGKRVVGIKNVTFNEEFFQGHFPGNPVMPGVLVLEAMAQVAGVGLLGVTPDREKKLLYLSGIDRCRFRRPVVPGDQLRIEAEIVSLKMRVCKCRATALRRRQALRRGRAALRAGGPAMRAADPPVGRRVARRRCSGDGRLDRSLRRHRRGGIASARGPRSATTRPSRGRPVSARTTGSSRTPLSGSSRRT